MEITQRTLTEAWQRTAARHALLEQVALPPVASSKDELKEWAARAEEAQDGRLRLLLDEDGTVRGHHGLHLEAFATRDLEQVMYLIAEAAIRRRGGSQEETADALDRIDPEWGRRFRGGGSDDTGTVEACGRDPLEGFAWVAESWREQDPYTTLAFFRAAPGRTVDAERLALLYGADPAQVAAGTRLRDLQAGNGGEFPGTVSGRAAVSGRREGGRSCCTTTRRRGPSRTRRRTRRSGSRRACGSAPPPRRPSTPSTTYGTVAASTTTGACWS
ncbi:hypothetical protein ACFWHQ_24880 [Streptomyces sp. NPDC060334]|uniref:hypothetical protein n=1 Tax=Streptomyces sp. NPDC060334 TaxID=3347099 RepID=UPI00365A0D5F